MRHVARLCATLVVVAALAVPTTVAASTHHLTTFQSPTHNIGCVLVGGVARCDIKHRDWHPPAHPASCPREVNYGQGVWITKGRAGFVCAGDTALDPDATVLHYGQTDRADGFTCTSASTGITCKSVTTHHGFFISIQAYGFF